MGMVGVAENSPAQEAGAKTGDRRRLVDQAVANRVWRAAF